MKCSWCEEEMTVDATTTCEVNEGAIPWDGEGRCHDCNVAPGGLHHIGCDMDKCQLCLGQAISCGCGDDEDD